MSTNLPALLPLHDVQTMAAAVAKSNLFGVKSQEQAFTLMMICQAEGMHPMTACMTYDIIDNKPSMKATAMLSRFQQAGGNVEWSERTDTRVCATFSHPAGGSIEVDWTMDRARQANLAGKDNWRKYPRQMLTARVIAEGVRTVYPAALGGFHTRDENEDAAPPRDVNPRPPTRDDPPRKPESNGAVYDTETGEVIDTTSSEPTAEQRAEWEQIARYEAWGNAVIKRMGTVTKPDRIDEWLAANKGKLEEVHLVAADVAMAVIAAADQRKKALGTSRPDLETVEF